MSANLDTYLDKSNRYNLAVYRLGTDWILYRLEQCIRLIDAEIRAKVPEEDDFFDTSVGYGLDTYGVRELVETRARVCAMWDRRYKYLDNKICDVFAEFTTEELELWVP